MKKQLIDIDTFILNLVIKMKPFVSLLVLVGVVVIFGNIVFIVHFFPSLIVLISIIPMGIILFTFVFIVIRIQKFK